MIMISLSVTLCSSLLLRFIQPYHQIGVLKQHSKSVRGITLEIVCKCGQSTVYWEVKVAGYLK